jgi:hypothetical protein
MLRKVRSLSIQEANLTKANSNGYTVHAKTLRMTIGSGVLMNLLPLAIALTARGLHPDQRLG